MVALSPARHIENIVRGCFRADVRRIHCILTAVHDIIVDAVLDYVATHFQGRTADGCWFRSQ